MKNKKFINLSKSGQKSFGFLIFLNFLKAQCLLLKLLEKNSEKRIDLKQICFSKWFLGNYKKHNNTNQPIVKAESSTKVEWSTGQKSSLTENITPPKHKKKAMKPKISCFGKISEKDLGGECINGGEIAFITAIRNYYFEPHFFENTVKLDGIPYNTLLISNNSPIIIGDNNSSNSNNQESENLNSEFRKRFEKMTDKKMLAPKKFNSGNQCSIIENMDFNNPRSCLYLAVK